MKLPMLFNRRESERLTLELNWLLPHAIPDFISEVKEDFDVLNRERGFSFSKDYLAYELFTGAMLASIRKGYSLKVQQVGIDRYRLNYDHKGISNPSAVKRWLESAAKNGEKPFELRYGDSKELRSALPLRCYNDGVHCLTTVGYRNFRLSKIRSIHAVKQNRLGTDATLELKVTRRGIEVFQGSVIP